MKIKLLDGAIAPALISKAKPSLRSGSPHEPDPTQKISTLATLR
jgi:hypothetical protein